MVVMAGSLHLQVDLKSSPEMSSTSLLTIGELARRTNRRPSALRYYEEIGLLAQPIRVSGQRRYPVETVRTLAIVDTAQRAGLSLEEIKTLLAGDSTEELRRIAERRLPEVDALLERATVVRSWLHAAARCECPSLDDCCLFEEAETPVLA
jgi:MerR family transcriptional regulator, redox-sensitive transcriptional activator SoxR